MSASPLTPRRQWALLGLACLAYLVAFAATYPPLPSIEDEVGFLNQAVVWSRGATSAEGAGFEGGLGDFVRVGDRHVGWRNPGRSLVTVPFLWLGERTVFASGALIHLGLTLLTALCLVRLGLPPLGALLVLAHPTLALYSRTVMADELAALLLVGGLYGALRTDRRGLWLGLGIGAAAWARYHVGVLLPCAALALALQPEREQRRREALTCLAAGAAWGAALVGYNLAAFGHPLGLRGQGSFGLAFLGPNLLHYGMALLLIWPGMLLTPVWLRGPWRGVLLALALPLLALLLGYYWFDRHATWVGTLVVGQRLLQPVLPVWVVIYVAVLCERLGPRLGERARRARPGLALAVTLAAVAGLVGLFAQHQRHLRRLEAARDEVAAAVPAGAVLFCNRSLAKLFEVPRGGELRYRLRYYEYQGQLRLEADWRRVPGLHLGHLTRGGPPPAVLREAAELLQATQVPTTQPGLTLYRVEAP